MDWEQYAKELEEIIEAITMPEHRRITVDAFVKQARKKAEGIGVHGGPERGRT